MIFGKGECRRTRRTSNENLTKSAKMAAFWQGSFYSWLACRTTLLSAFDILRLFSTKLARNRLYFTRSAFCFAVEKWYNISSRRDYGRKIKELRL